MTYHRATLIMEDIMSLSISRNKTPYLERSMNLNMGQAPTESAQLVNKLKVFLKD